MKLDEETVKAIAILNGCGNETGNAEGNAILHRATRYLVMQNKIPTELPDAILIPAGRAWVTGVTNGEHARRSVLLKTTLKANTVKGLCARSGKLAEDYPGHPAMVSWMARLLLLATCVSGLCHNYVMAVRTTVDIPEPLHDQLRQRAENTGTSIRSLIVEAIEQAYSVARKGKMVTGPMIKAGGRRGPLYPTDENPYDLIVP